MTIDERIERLTERHEALAATVEMVEHQIHENTKNIGSLIATVHSLANTVEGLVTVARQHQNRLDRLEGSL